MEKQKYQNTEANKANIFIQNGAAIVWSFSSLPPAKFFISYRW